MEPPSVKKPKQATSTQQSVLPAGTSTGKAASRVPQVASAAQQAARRVQEQALKDKIKADQDKARKAADDILNSIPPLSVKNADGGDRKRVKKTQ